MSILDEAIAAAGVDPRELHAKLMAGQQDRTIALSRAFEEAGNTAGDAYERPRRAHGEVAGGFAAGGGPVLDAGAQDGQAWRLLGQGGQDMHTVAGLLRRAVHALDDAQRESTGVTDRMIIDLNSTAAAYTDFARTSPLVGPADRQAYLDRAVRIVKTAAGEIQRITDGYDRVLSAGTAELAGRGFVDAPAGTGPLGVDAARRDADLLRTALADPDAADVLLDEATRTLQGIDAQLRAGQPLTAEQQRYVTEFASAAGVDALAAIPGFADIGVQQGADRAESALAGTLSALTNPALGGTADPAALPAVLRTLTDDPLAAADDPARRDELVPALEALPRYEGVNQLLSATNVPLGEQYGVSAGQQALRTSQLTAQLLDPQHYPVPYGFNTDANSAELQAAARGASLQLGNAARNLDSAQQLLLDPDTRRSLLVTPHADATGAVALLDRATARLVPVPDVGGDPLARPQAEASARQNAEQNAQVAAAVLTDVAGDPQGWREAIGRGTPISDEITRIAADNINAFGSNSDAAVDVFAAARIPEGYYGGFGLGKQDAQDALTFIGAGRGADGPDADLVRVHEAAQDFTAKQVERAASGQLDPGTAFGTAGSVAAAVNTADFRTAMHVYADADAARTRVFENSSLAAGVLAGKAVELATSPLPGIVGDGVSALVDQAIDGYQPEDTAGQQGAALVERMAGRQTVELDHLVVSSLERAGRLPVDAPDLDAVLDESGRMPPLESFRDGNPDADVTAADTAPRDALAAAARHGPGGDPAWRSAVDRYQFTVATELSGLDPDHAVPEPRRPLESADLERLRGEDRVPWNLR